MYISSSGGYFSIFFIFYCRTGDWFRKYRQSRRNVVVELGHLCIKHQVSIQTMAFREVEREIFIYLIESIFF